MARSYTAFAHDGTVIPATCCAAPRPAGGGHAGVLGQDRERCAQDAAPGAGPGGTGQKAQTVGYSVGGKTGTARKQVGKGYAAHKYRAWFVGIAPIDSRASSSA
jgi:cell division protein FtsI (penicillin-binding protein 3)